MSKIHDCLIRNNSRRLRLKRFRNNAKTILDNEKYSLWSSSEIKANYSFSMGNTNDVPNDVRYKKMKSEDRALVWCAFLENGISRLYVGWISGEVIADILYPNASW